MNVAPMLPDIRRGTVELLLDKTIAEDRVAFETPRAGRAPRIQVEHAGSIGLADNKVERARIVLHQYGNWGDEAWRLAYQVRDVLVPPENVTWGVHALVSYTDDQGTQRRVRFSGRSWRTDRGRRQTAGTG